MTQTPDYVHANVDMWQGRGDIERDVARRQWDKPEPTWGVFGIPEQVAHLLPAELDGIRAVELGCGTGYVSSWLIRRGAQSIGVDPTPGQLDIARACQDDFGLHFPLVQAAGEQVPLRDACCDLVISEYGAAIWADPYAWIPEAARLLRSGGQLLFMCNSTLLELCMPSEGDEPWQAGERLLHPLFGMYRQGWSDDTCEFHLSHGNWIKLLRANGFEIEELIELRPPDDAELNETYPFVTPEWAKRWPAEEAWRACRVPRR